MAPRGRPSGSMRVWTFGELYAALPHDVPRRSLLRVETELSRPGGPWMEEVASAFDQLGRELPWSLRPSLLGLLELRGAPAAVLALADQRLMAPSR